MAEEKNYQIGVLVGRFQVHELHQAHKHLIETVVGNHKKVIIFLGVSSDIGSRENPMGFETRKLMVNELFPNVTVIPISDVGNDEIWSNNLDRKIREVYRTGDVLLYGGRDSFIEHYMGRFDTHVLEPNIYVSGTEVRKTVSEEVKSSKDFRSGLIYQAYNQYPKVFPTVDVVPYKEQDGKVHVLIAKKPNEDRWRMIGGFVDPTDDSMELAARRELNEETGKKGEFSDFEYVTSAKVDDWRYRGKVNQIITTVFMCKYIYGQVIPSDDISALQWVEVDELGSEGFINKNIVNEHQKMVYSVHQFIKNKYNNTFKTIES